MTEKALGEGVKFHHDYLYHERFRGFGCLVRILFCLSLILRHSIFCRTYNCIHLFALRFSFFWCMLSVTFVPLGFITTDFIRT